MTTYRGSGNVIAGNLIGVDAVQVTVDDVANNFVATDVENILAELATDITNTYSANQTLTNKTINLGSNTLSGTTAQFNTALSDGDFATLAGSETITNKTIALGSNTLSGTSAQFDAALSDDNFTYSSILASNTTGQGASLVGFDLTNQTVEAGATQQVNGVAALRGINPVATRQIYLAYHATAGDGGHGYFRALTTGGPYTDDNGITIVPTGGDGSSCWRRVYSGAVNVRWYGAQGDNSTDDTTAIQSAIDSRTDVYGPSVYIPEGTYKITSVVRLRRNLKLVGDGKTLTVIRQYGDVSAFEMNETTDGQLVYSISIEGMTIQKNTETATTGIYGVALVGTTNNVWGCKLKNVNAIDFYVGFYIARPILTELDNCEAFSNVSHGFHIAGSGTSIIFNNTYGRLNGGSGYHVRGALQYLSFQTAAADQNTLHGYNIGGDGSSFPTGVSMTGSGAEANTKDGFYFENAENITISGCYSYSNTENGYKFDGARGCSLVNSRAQSNTLWGATSSTSSVPKIPSTITSFGSSYASNGSGRIGDLSVIADIFSPDTNTFDYAGAVDAATGFRVNGTSIVNSSRVVQNLGFGSETYHWYKLTATYANFAAAALIGDYAIPAQIPAGSYIVDVLFELTTEFSGGGVTAATLEIGDAGSAYNNHILATNVFTGAGTGYKSTAVTSRGARLYDATNKSLRDFVSTNRQMYARLRTTTANTDQLTAGAVTIWIGFIKLP